MRTKHFLTGTALAALMAIGATATGATETEDKANMEVGVLTCETVDGTQVNLIIHSSVNLDCVFETPRGSERYVGETGVGLGLDLNFDRDATMRFSVVSAGDKVGPGEHNLSGKYVGGRASITVIKGIGAQALIGGSNDNIALQPIAIETGEGLGLSGGLSYLFLEAPKS
ncbi:MAG: DUF992 domain-containing protein [Proteobacteria bacterium]|nr:DUF992 domain-containing protein [Pseudomonadota bacterium]